MKVLIVLAALVACSVGLTHFPYAHGYLGYPATAAYHGYSAHPYAYGHGYLPSYHATQYHSQDEFGQASFGYAHPGQAHAATRDAHGGVIGSYSYINAEGKEVIANYIADALGFRIASNDLPVAPVANLEQPVFNLVGPAPVQDTPEVAAAKAEHLAAIEAAKAGSRRKRQVAAIALAAHYPHHCVGHNCDLPLLGLGHHCFGHNCQLPTPLAAPYTIAHHAAPTLEATLTKIVHNPNHALSYRVD